MLLFPKLRLNELYTLKVIKIVAALSIDRNAFLYLTRKFGRISDAKHKLLKKISRTF